MNPLQLLLLPFFTVNNIIRGGGGLFGLNTANLPGTTDAFCAVFVAIAAYFMGVHTWVLDLLPTTIYGVIVAPYIPYVASLFFALCWLAWSTPAWGFLQGLGAGPGPTVRQISWYEKLFLKTGSVYLAFGLRTTLFLLPMSIIFGWPWILLGPMQVLLYSVAWAIRPGNMSGIPIGEALTGFAWGVMALLYVQIGF